MISEKDIQYFAQELSEDECLDLEIAEMALRGALDSHLGEDGEIDDFEAFFEDAVGMARALERDGLK